MKIWIWHIFFTVLFLVHVQNLSSQLKINEYMASNSSINQDPDFQSYADWVEIFNAGSSAINLKGYYLTDNISLPVKWQVPNDAIIDAGGFLIIWCDGENSGLHTGFKLSADGEEIGLFSPTLVLLDTLHFSAQKTDISSGRSINGAGIWGSYLQPTPGTSNANAQFFSDYAKNSPVFSITGGIYDSPFNLSLSTPLGGAIRYTLDGSEPDENSTLFSSELEISANTIIRARVFKDGMIPGPVITHSYFLEGDLKNRKLPVVSISTKPENLWDPVKGIYVQDFKPDWEIAANIELFENNGSDRAAFNEQVGIKVNGLYSWQLPQKMLGIYFKSQYGSSNLGYHLMFHKERNSYDDFALRASGSDWSYTLFRDILGQDASRLNTKLDFMDFRPSICFFNGEYMGIHNIREKVNTDFIQKNHKLAAGTFDLIENEDFAEAGTLDAYNFLQTLLVKDLSVPTYYNDVAQVIDIENFTDLVITEMAVANTSIDHNVMAWKPKDSGKWKWVIMDLDRGFFNPGSNLTSFYLSQNSFPFRELWNNEEYVKYFGQRLADQLYTTYHPERVKKLIESHASDIENEVPYHVEKWLGATSSYGNAIPTFDYWVSKVNDLKTFADARPKALLVDMSSYGFDGIADLFLATNPPKAGDLKINNLQIPEDIWVGPYLKNLTIKISAEDKPGYNFQAWKSAIKNVLIPAGSVWKYLDLGIDQGNQWRLPAFDDSSWKSGPAQLGYGEGDEATTVEYGPSTTNRYVTTYFRKTFNLQAQDLQASSYILELLIDDGAVVYINGNEAVRVNMTYNNIVYNSLAPISISGNLENVFTTYIIDGSLLVEGQNTITVELHQNVRNSSDLSFDLILSGLEPGSTILSNNREVSLNYTDDSYFIADYLPSGECILPEIISGELVLDLSCSPYLVSGDVRVSSGSTLKINPGVELYFAPKANLIVEGNIEAIGTESQRILFTSNPEFTEQSWGAISFLNCSDTSVFAYATIENASEGEVPVRDYAALSAFNSDLVLDNLIIENVHSNPIVARYSDVVLTNSKLHSNVPGDIINVKYGTARIENSIFRGSISSDGDGIDYDGIENGIIRNCIIYNCLGFNSDAVDVGENVKNLIIDSLFIANIFDKGVSVGQNSSATITNSSFVNCNIGVGVKDLSPVSIDHCSFYGNGIPVSCYEKNPGSAGGIAVAKNSILSNSYLSSYYSDVMSSLDISYSISDNTVLPDNPGNIFGNPMFTNPVFMDYSLRPGSPAILSGNEGGLAINMGSINEKIELEPYPMITHIFLNPLNSLLPEFIAIYNPSKKTADLSGYSIGRGLTYTFPEGINLAPEETLYLTSDLSTGAWENFGKQVYQWTEGKLENNQESIDLLEKNGLVIDYLHYSAQENWPTAAFTEEKMMSLFSTTSDNHFGENWFAEPVARVFASIDTLENEKLSVYPNPTYDRVWLKIPSQLKSDIQIYSYQGKLLGIESCKEFGDTELNLAKYGQGVLFLKIGNTMKKVIVIK